jgi:hypothetical protein
MAYIGFVDSLRARAAELERRAATYDAAGNVYMAAEMRRRAANKRRLIRSHEEFLRLGTKITGVQEQ